MTYSASVDGQPFEPLSDYANMVRILNEGHAARDGTMVRGPYTPGSTLVDHRPYIEKTLMLETQIRHTDPTGAVTHLEGASGHAAENLGHINRLLGGGYGPATLRRTWPHTGQTERPVEGIGEPFVTQNTSTYVFPLMSVWPFWTATAVSSTGGNPDVVGAAPIYDPIVTFTGGTDPTVTVGVYELGVVGAVPAGGVRFDVGAGTITRVTGGTDYSEFGTVSHGEWLVLKRGINTVVYAGGGTYTVDWYEQWH